MAGPERLLFEIVSRDLDPGAFRAAAALVHELDLAARERIAIHERCYEQPCLTFPPTSATRSCGDTDSMSPTLGRPR
jgi:hypothetical protein